MHMRGVKLRQVLLAIALPAAPLPPAVNAQVIGACYDITAGEWAAVDSTHTASLPRPRRPDLSGDSVIYTLPPRVQLRGTPWRGPGNRYVLAVPENSLQVPHSQLSWRGDADSLRLVVSTGFAGTVSRLTPAGHDWVGFAQTFSDVLGLLRFRRPIRLVRVDCAAPPPVPSTSDQPLLRQIELASSGRLTLGETLPAGVRTGPRRSNAVTVEVRATGLLAGAYTVITRMDPAGRVRHIELRYREGHDLSAAVGAFVRQYGPGRTVGTAGMVFWHNRTTTLIISPAGPEPRVVLNDPRFP
jgi:hypothetical protein